MIKNAKNKIQNQPPFNRHIIGSVDCCMRIARLPKLASSDSVRKRCLDNLRQLELRSIFRGWRHAISNRSYISLRDSRDFHKLAYVPELSIFWTTKSPAKEMKMAMKLDRPRMYVDFNEMLELHELTSLAFKNLTTKLDSDGKIHFGSPCPKDWKFTSTKTPTSTATMTTCWPMGFASSIHLPIGHPR